MLSELGVVPEPGPGRGLHAVGAAAEVHGVEVAGEDLLLVEICCSSFTAMTASLILRVAVCSEVRYSCLTYCWVMVEPPWRTPLPGDGSMAARAMPDGVDAAVLEEVPVLGRDHRLAEDVGDLLRGEDHPVLRGEAGRARWSRPRSRSSSSAAKTGVVGVWDRGARVGDRRPRSTPSRTAARNSEPEHN